MSCDGNNNAYLYFTARVCKHIVYCLLSFCAGDCTCLDKSRWSKSFWNESLDVGSDRRSMVGSRESSYILQKIWIDFQPCFYYSFDIEAVLVKKSANSSEKKTIHLVSDVADFRLHQVFCVIVCFRVRIPKNGKLTQAQWTSNLQCFSLF